MREMEPQLWDPNQTTSVCFYVWSFIRNELHSWNVLLSVFKLHFSDTEIPFLFYLHDDLRSTKSIPVGQNKTGHGFEGLFI